MATKRQATGAVKTLRAFIKKCKDAKAAGLHDPSRRKKSKRKRTRRDWPGHKKAHRRAAKKGWRGRKRRDPRKRRRASRRRDPAFYGHKRAHRAAAKKGWRRRTRGRRDAGDPRRFRRAHLGHGRRAAGPWYMTHDPES